MYELSALGFGLFFEEQLQSFDYSRVARIAAEHRGAYEVWSAEGVNSAQVAGRLRRELPKSGLPGAGDWVVLRETASRDGISVIDAVLERRTLFTRGAAGRANAAQVVAANVDLLLAVCGLDSDFNVRRIERYLALIGASGADAAIVLNKADICGDIDARVAQVERHCPGVRIFVISALRSRGIEAIRECIGYGETVALVGSSGAGKSTLVNALLGEERMQTGEVRESDGRGCHVTTHRQLILLPDGGLLLDTPGMRELQLVDERGIDAVFGDIATISSGCRFRDCRHDSEPGCAVKEAVESEDLDAERLQHYRKLEKEVKSYELRQNEHLRRKSERIWGQLSDEVAMLRKWRGK